MFEILFSQLGVIVVIGFIALVKKELEE